MGPARRHAGRNRPGKAMTSVRPTSPSPSHARWVPSLSPVKGGEGTTALPCLPLRPWGGRGPGGGGGFGAMAQLDDVITYLEMKARPVLPRIPAPNAKLALIRTENCTVSFYRYLYETVGTPWLW